MRLPKLHACSSRAAGCLIVDMTSHEREEYRQRMGHVWLGFSDDQIQRYLSQAGFVDVRIHPLPPAEEAKGPTLFAASGTRRAGL